jgi:hypothetical protein
VLVDRWHGDLGERPLRFRRVWAASCSQRPPRNQPSRPTTRIQRRAEDVDARRTCRAAISRLPASSNGYVPQSMRSSVTQASTAGPGPESPSISSMTTDVAPGSGLRVTPPPVATAPIALSVVELMMVGGEKASKMIYRQLPG